MNEVRFGIVGLGTIGQVHAEAVLAAPGCTLAGVVDTDAERASAWGDKYGCPWYTSVDALVAQKELDVVNICTPSGAHLEPAVVAAQAGKHVLVEKPLEVTTTRCDIIIKACNEAGVLLGGVFQNRLFDANRLLEKAIRQERFGRMVLGSVQLKWWRSQEYYDSGTWRGTQAMDGGGVLMNQTIHRIDLLQWMLGDVASVFAYTDCLAHSRLEVEDTAVGVMRFKSGALGVLIAATSTNPGFPARLELHGDKGGAILEDNKVITWQGEAISAQESAEIVGQFAQQKRAGAMANPNGLDHQGHIRQVADMADAVRNKRSPFVTGEEARKSVAIIEALYESARCGRPIECD